MKPIKEYSFCKGDAWEYISPVSSIACSIEYDYPSSALHDRAVELTQSFFNQWLFVVNAYDKLEKAHRILNDHSDDAQSAGHITPYITQSIINENQFRDDAYLLMISIKSFLDLFACVVDFIENKIVREENEMPDVRNIDRKIKGNPDLMDVFAQIRDKSIYPWIDLVTDIRHKIIHRGYQLKPIFEFMKEQELTVRVYKGTDMYINVINIAIGQLFEDFIRDISKIESVISDILQLHFNSVVPVEASITYDQGINIYYYKDTIGRQ